MARLVCGVLVYVVGELKVWATNFGRHILLAYRLLLQDSAAVNGSCIEAAVKGSCIEAKCGPSRRRLLGRCMCFHSSSAVC